MRSDRTRNGTRRMALRGWYPNLKASTASWALATTRSVRNRPAKRSSPSGWGRPAKVTGGSGKAASTTAETTSPLIRLAQENTPQSSIHTVTSTATVMMRSRHRVRAGTGRGAGVAVWFMAPRQRRLERRVPGRAAAQLPGWCRLTGARRPPVSPVPSTTSASVDPTIRRGSTRPGAGALTAGVSACGVRQKARFQTRPIAIEGEQAGHHAGADKQPGQRATVGDTGLQ
jgi:hypothetical protein